MVKVPCSNCTKIFLTFFGCLEIWQGLAGRGKNGFCHILEGKFFFSKKIFFSAKTTFPEWDNIRTFLGGNVFPMIDIPVDRVQDQCYKTVPNQRICV